MIAMRRLQHLRLSRQRRLEFPQSFPIYPYFIRENHIERAILRVGHLM
jgi:hypothetical protein